MIAIGNLPEQATKLVNVQLKLVYFSIDELVGTNAIELKHSIDMSQYLAGAVTRQSGVNVAVVAVGDLQLSMKTAKQRNAYR